MKPSRITLWELVSFPEAIAIVSDLLREQRQFTCYYSQTGRWIVSSPILVTRTAPAPKTAA